MEKSSEGACRVNKIAYDFLSLRHGDFLKFALQTTDSMIEKRTGREIHEISFPNNTGHIINVFNMRWVLAERMRKREGDRQKFNCL